MREKYPRPEVRDLGTKWKLVYCDYSSLPRRKRSKVWGKQRALSKREAQRLADEFMEKVNARNNEPGLYPSDDESLAPPEELNPAALRVLLRQIPFAGLGNNETPQTEHHRASGLLQFVPSAAFCQIDPADARLFAGAPESSEGVGND